MNGLEAKFMAELERAVTGSDYSWVGFERIQLKLADRTTYTPDFAVVGPSGEMVMYEVKGFWRDDARVKLKVAAEQFPFFTFYAVTLKKREWQYERIGE